MDATRAVVPGAEVTITSQATGETRRIVSNDSGEYRFDLMSAGKYSVKVSKQGFKAVEQNLELLVGRNSQCERYSFAGRNDRGD